MSLRRRKQNILLRETGRPASLFIKERGRHVDVPPLLRNLSQTANKYKSFIKLCGRPQFCHIILKLLVITVVVRQIAAGGYGEVRISLEFYIILDRKSVV